MAGFVLYNPDEPRRAKNMDYKKVREDHRRSITQWHQTGWSQTQIRVGLEEKGLTASDSQVSTILTQLGLVRANKGQVLPNLEHKITYANIIDGQTAQPAQNTDMNITDDVDIRVLGDLPDQHAADTLVLYGSVHDDDDFYEITGMPPDPSISDATSSAAKLLLTSELVTGGEEFFDVGLVFATVISKSVSKTPMKSDPQAPVDKTCVRVWLVVKKFFDSCFCVRIRTYQGNGIKHFKADLEIQSLNKDKKIRKIQQGLVQKDIDAHAIVYPDGLRSAYFDRDEEPPMTKQDLAVILEDGFGPEVIDRMSRASFTRLYELKYGMDVARVGRLTPLSANFANIYTRELWGEDCKPQCHRQ